MKNQFNLIFALAIGLFLTACGGSPEKQIVDQLEEEKAEVATSFKNMEADMVKLKAQEKELDVLVASLPAANEQVNVLVQQYKMIRTTLATSVSKYTRSISSYNALTEQAKKGEITGQQLEVAAKKLQESSDIITKKAEMTVEELGRIKEAVEKAIKNPQKTIKTSTPKSVTPAPTQAAKGQETEGEKLNILDELKKKQ